VLVPDPVLERMRRAQARGPERAREEGLALAREVLAQVRTLVHGVQVSAPGGAVSAALSVLEGLEAGAVEPVRSVAASRRARRPNPRPSCARCRRCSPD
jgi:hypothetical protein